jgi:hypothetical protein
MAGKLVQLNEAAEMLGISPDELIKLRQRNEIHGYRDGASWKFKIEEVQRVAEERGIEVPGLRPPSDLDMAIEGSSINLTSSSLGLAGDLGLKGEGSGDLAGKKEASRRSRKKEEVLDLGEELELAEEEAKPVGKAPAKDASKGKVTGKGKEEPKAKRPAETKASQKPAAKPAPADDIDELMSDVIKDEDSDDDLGSILVSEEELGHSGETTASTIIGKRITPPADDSDILLGEEAVTDSNLEISSDALGSDIQLVTGGSDALASDSDLAGGSDTGVGSELQLDSSAAKGSGINLVAGESHAMTPGEELELGGDTGIGSDVELVPDVEGSGVNLIAGGSDALSKGSDVLTDELKTGSSTGGGSGTGKLTADGAAVVADEDLELALDGDLALTDDEEISLDESKAGQAEVTFDDADLQLDDGHSPESSGIMAGGGKGDLAELSADTGTGSDVGSDISIEPEEDDMEMLTAGSAAGSDLTLGAESGINLSPTDSGLSLEEEPLDLGGSSVEQLELPEDEDMISLEEPADQDAATQLKADDEFLLTPVEEAEDESSGSQVIALEDSEVYADADAQTMLGGMGEAGAGALVAEDDFMLTPAQPGAAGMTAQPIAAGLAHAPALPEAKYSVWNVLSLLVILLLLATTGTMMVDLMRNLWEYDQPATASTSLMDTIIKAINLQP